MPNPFHYGKHVTPEQFIGRRAELARLFSALEVTHTGQLQSVSVVGPRRIGKTSLLHYAAARYAEFLLDPRNYRFARVDLSDAECRTQSGLLATILSKLHLAIPSNGNTSLIEFQHQIRALHTAGGLPVVLLDEFGKLTGRPDEYSTDLFDSWRALMDENVIAFVTASPQPLSELAQAQRYTSPFFNIFMMLPLGAFTSDEAEQLIRRGAECDRPFSLVEQRQMRELGGLHPYKLQLAGALLYQHKEDGTAAEWKQVRQEFDRQVFETFRNQTELQPKKSTIKTILHDVVTFPRTLGRALLDFFGHHDSFESSQWLWGILLIALIILVLLGIVRLDVIQAWLGTLTGAGSK